MPSLAPHFDYSLEISGSHMLMGRLTPDKAPVLTISSGDIVILISRNHGILDINDIFEDSLLDMGAAQ